MYTIDGNFFYSSLNFFSALDDDDVAVLDLIARSGGDLSRPRPITGSSAREDQMQEYSLDGIFSFILFHMFISIHML